MNILSLHVQLECKNEPFYNDNCIKELYFDGNIPKTVNGEWERKVHIKSSFIENIAGCVIGKLARNIYHVMGFLME